MVIVHRLQAGASRYYLAAVAPGGGAAPRIGEAPGRWMGGAAAARDLHGAVDGRELRRLLPEERGRLPGFDVTFAAPKSVSILHGLGPSPVADAVARAHDAAVHAGLDYLERHACAVRVQGRVVGADGFAAAAFVHRTSRAADPHLHTHVIIANLAAARDGQWRALYTPLLYADRRGAEATYHVVLRGALTASLGLRWGAAMKGRADTPAVPDAVRAAFSTRRAELLAAASGAVGDRPWAERVTRPPRDGLVDHDRLGAEWRCRAAALGWVVPSSPARRIPVTPSIDGEVIPTSDQWTRAELMVALANHWTDGAPANEVRAACEQLLASSQVIALPGGMHAADRFTTRAAQRRVLEVADRLGGRSVAGDPEAMDEHRRRLARDGRRLLVVVGDGEAAELVAARTGARTVASAAAARAVGELDAGDVVLLSRAGRLPSRDVEAVLDVATRRRVAVVTGERDRSPDRTSHASGGAGPITVAVPGGDVTGSPTARLAADTAIADWLARRRTGADAVIVAEGQEVDTLNARARAALRAAGMLGPDEATGFAVGDTVRFGHARVARGIARHAQGDVIEADPRRGLVVRLRDGPAVALAASDLRGVRHAHVVPPLPALVAGRGDVFVVGGREIAGRHLDGHALHRYLTVDGPALAARRWADPPRLHQSVDGADRDRPGVRWPSPRPRVDAAAEWVAVATERLQRAEAGGDREAAAAWRVQLIVATREARRQRIDVDRCPEPSDERPAAVERTGWQLPIAARAVGRDVGLSR